MYSHIVVISKEGSVAQNPYELHRSHAPAQVSFCHSSKWLNKFSERGRQHEQHSITTNGMYVSKPYKMCRVNKMSLECDS
eukprot:1554015-Amphidinium_carterae.1